MRDTPEVRKMRSKTGNETGGAKSPTKAGEGVVAHDGNRAGATCGHNHSELAEHESEARFGAIPVPRAKPQALFKNANELFIADGPLEEAFANMVPEKE